MYQIVVLVLDDITQCPAVCDAWEAVGVSGITILESTGLGRMRRLGGLSDHLPLMPNIMDLLQSREEHHRTMFTLVDDDAMVDKIVAATESVAGDLDEANKGVLFVMPVSRILGIPGMNTETEKETP